MNTSTTSRPKVLVMHALRPTSRQTTIDHLESFRGHLPNADVQYLHFQQPLPKEFEEITPDVFIINYDFLNYRFTPLWPYIKNRHKKIAQRAGKVVAIPQDDFWANKLLDNWCMDWDVDRILTPISNDLEVLYPRSIKTKEFRTALTGYVKSGPIPQTALLRDRPIDLGQRVRDMPPHLGRLAQAKSKQAVVMATAATSVGFKVDVSTRVEDSFIGAAWFDFLSSCKFTVGMKGGASLHDPYGLTHTKVQAYLARHPEASFDEIERKCFNGKDLKYEFTAISPRLFESSMAGTCQILQRDEYLGVLEPWRDYIPLERNFSNVNEVVSTMRDLDKCQEIVTNAQIALVDSQLFDYSQLVDSACGGFLNQQASDCKKWNRFSDFLGFSRSAQELAPELHNAAIHWIVGEISGLNRSPNSTRVILEKTKESDLNGWLETLKLLAKLDYTGMRSPWIWNSL